MKVRMRKKEKREQGLRKQGVVDLPPEASSFITTS